MRRRTFLATAAGAAGCSADRRARLNVFNWSAYVAPDTIPNFEAEFGVKVRYSVYESNEEMLARVFSGNSGWDVVFPSNYFIRPMRENDLLAPLRHDLLPGLKNLDDLFRAPQWDPKLEWSVPYMWAATGIVYNRKVQPPPQSWADMWSARLSGHMTMLDDPGEVLGAALLKLGLNLNSQDAGDLVRAKNEAVAQKKLLRAYLNAEVRDQLVAGDVLAAQLWSTTAQQAMDAAPQLDFAFPSEGFALYVDNAVILRESRRQELAHAFIEYLLRPKVAAAIAVSVRTASANGAARELLPQKERENPVLYPSRQTLARGQWFEALTPAAQRMRDRLWTEIKSA
jgi:spermidine/putrescine transport system substrate-binding protein